MGKNPDLSIGDLLAGMGEELKRTAYEPNINAYKPHPKQVKFHQAIEKRIRLYIGGNRSGKSTAGIVEDIWWLTKRHPYRTFGPRPILGRLVTTSYLDGVQKVIIPMLKQWIPKSELRGGSWSSAYDVGFRTLHFDNGSQLELMSYDQDLEKFAGTSRDFVHYDEEPPKDIFTECQMRLIDRKGSSWLTMTPVEGMTWVFDDIYEKAETNPRIGVIEVGIEENPYLDQSEVDEVMDGLDDDEKSARAQGKFVQLGGLVYRKFDRNIHVIPAMDPRELHSVAFKHYMSLDHGFNNPTSVHWHAVDRRNKVITFDEHYERERIIEYHAAVIKDREKAHGRKPDIRVCDPALAQRQGVTGTSIQTEYAIRGIGFALGNNDVLTGVAKINEYLELGPDGKPSWYITENCHNLIREIMRLRWQTFATKKMASQNNPHDKIHKKDDHACDDCRYFFTLMPNLAPATPKPIPTVVPEVGGNSAVVPGFRIDPNTTPEGLTRHRTQWTRVDLSD
jgi:phage terminase large subunit-like protein